jgi:HlyD family secretion protein
MPEKIAFDARINHVDDLDEVFGRPPSKLVHWSILSVGIFLLLLILASRIIKYAEVISAKVFIKAIMSPKPVVARQSGKIVKLFVRENMLVKKNDILAYIESIGNHDQIINLSEELNSLLTYIKNDHWGELYNYSPINYANLGELQAPYQALVSNLMRIKAYQKDGSFIKSIGLLEKEIEDHKQLDRNFHSQKDIYEADYRLAANEFDAKESLYLDKVIPLMEYNQSKSSLLGKQIPLTNISSSIISNNTAVIAKQQEILNIQRSFEVEKGNFIQSLNTLISGVDSWKRQYVLTAPVSGAVIFSSIIQENQVVTTGEELLYVSPQSNGYVGQMYVSQDRLGKIETGQTVLINVASYPSDEYGKLKGTISFISSVPNKEMEYLVTVELNRELRSDQDVKFNFRNDLLGQAEIITSKTRLFNKLLFTFHKLMDNQLSK